MASSRAMIRGCVRLPSICVPLPMPNKYARKTNIAGWSEETLHNALAAIDSGRKIREVSRSFNIHEATLRARRKKNDNSGPRLGRPSTFSAETETLMANHVLKLAKLFHGLTPMELRKIAFQYAETNGIRHDFNKNRQEAGKDWLKLFLKRNPQISLRKPEGTSVNRITAFNEESVKIFFSNLANLLQKYKFVPSRMFNVDETGISTVQKPTKQLGPKGVKQFGSKISWERGKNVTAICAMSASGSFIPPLLIFPRKRMSPTLTKNGPVEGIYAVTDNGWSDEKCFHKWLQHFKLYVNSSPANPVLLVLDNHYSHISLIIYQYCRDNGIVMLSIPPHTSHRLQPLDTSFFGPFKCAFNRECDIFLKTGKQEKISFQDLAEIFNNAYVKIATMEKAISGFYSSGIYPYNPDKFTKEDFAAASQYLPTVTDDLDSTNELEPGPSTSYIRAKAQTCVENKSKTGALAKEKTSIEELSPLPSYSGKGKTKKSTKGKSEILTATPMKLILEEKQRKKSKVSAARESKNKNVKVKISLRKKQTNSRNMELDSDTSEDDNVDEKDLVDDDELDDIVNMDVSSIEKEICLICEDFGKDGEIWYRCVSCGRWAHAECSGRDTATDYKCDFCYKKHFAKRDLTLKL